MGYRSQVRGYERAKTILKSEYRKKQRDCECIHTKYHEPPNYHWVPAL